MVLLSIRAQENDLLVNVNLFIGISIRVDSALRALSTLRGLRGAPAVPPLCRETQSLGQQMLNAMFTANVVFAQG